jgi:hypothetical protein
MFDLLAAAGLEHRERAAHAGLNAARKVECGDDTTVSWVCFRCRA